MKEWLNFKRYPIFPKTWYSDNGVGIDGEISEIRKNCPFSKYFLLRKLGQKTEKTDRSRVEKNG